MVSGVQPFSYKHLRLMGINLGGPIFFQEVDRMAEKEEKEEKGGMPVKQEAFLEAGVHIGTKIRTSDMRPFIFKRRDDGLYILDLRKSAERLMAAAKLISKFSPEEVAVVASRIYSGNPAARFAKITGVNAIRGRFTPGTMTNMSFKGFTEPRLLIVCDPKGEKEALLESAKNGVTVIGFCDSDNETKYVDLIVPLNNKGKRSLALAFYILAREVMMATGKIKTYDEFPHDVQYFEQMIEEKEEEPEVEKPEEAEEPAEKPAAEEAKEEEKPKAKKEEAEGKKAEEKKKEEKPKEKKAEAKEEKPKKAAEKKPKEEKAEAKEEKPKKEEKKAPEKKKEEKAEAKEEKPKKEEKKAD
jgi:small subunit ribosomal protein S2